MTWTEGASAGAMNSTTPVAVVAAPAASTRRIVTKMEFNNRDTAAVVLTVRYVDGGNTYELFTKTLAAGDDLTWTGSLVLDTVNRSITALLGGAVAANQPHFVATYADAS